MDKYLLWHQLSLIQQLNCVCDTMAKQAVTLAMMQGYHDRPTQLLPKEDVAVVIWGNKITDDISSPLRFHASKEVARRYLGNRKKNPWPNEQFDKVEWEHLELAMKTKPDMYKIWRSKQNSGFCGIRVQVGRYSGIPGQDERSPNCGRREMAAHLLLCPSEDRTQLLGRQHRPGTSILDTQVRPNAGRQTLCRHGSNVSKDEGSGSESRQDRLLQLHGRSYSDTFLRSTKLPLGNVQQLPQWCRLG